MTTLDTRMTAEMKQFSLGYGNSDEVTKAIFDKASTMAGEDSVLNMVHLIWADELYVKDVMNAAFGMGSSNQLKWASRTYVRADFCKDL